MFETEIQITTASDMLTNDVSASEALAAVDAVLSRDDEESKALARVLSAIRGVDAPIADRDRVNATTTAVIRAAAFPLTAALRRGKSKDGRQVNWDMTVSDTVSIPSDAGVGSQFARHVRNAAAELGLTVK